jgi:16S rRNA (cytosine967-C5)-methyltransferase
VSPARIIANQQRTFLALLAGLRPHLRTSRSLPARIQAHLGRNRAIGSRDRRLYRELIYTTLRYLPWIEPELDRDPGRAAQIVAWLAGDAPATATFRAGLTRDWPPCPAGVESKAAFLGTTSEAVLPDWLRRECPAAFMPPERDALLARAPLWLRLQTGDPAPVLAEFRSQGWTWRRSPALPDALELPADADIAQTAAYTEGRLEIQDLGSQMILASVGLACGTHWLDACAGAGGKSLQLARLVGPQGSVDAHDVRPRALDELVRRAARAGLPNLRRLVTPPSGCYDGVLVDAPCTGTGTWRRAPHLKWITQPTDVTAAAALQSELLARFAAHVRPGGRLVYATCSLCRRENESVVEGFLTAHPDFAPEPFARTFGFAPGGVGLVILPAAHQTDGFFVASLRRRS